MKFRTDFVTNSSSSSYCIKVSVKLKNGEEVSYLAETVGEDGEYEPYIRYDASKCGKARNVQQLLETLCKTVVFPTGDDDEYDDEEFEDLLGSYDPEEVLNEFKAEYKETVSSLDDIQNVTIKGTFIASGDQTGGDIDGEAHDIIWKIKAKYPDLTESNRSEYSDLIPYVQGLLEESENFTDNDPEEFLTDYIPLFPNITKTSAAGLDPVAKYTTNCYDFTTKKESFKTESYVGEKAEKAWDNI